MPNLMFAKWDVLVEYSCEPQLISIIATDGEHYIGLAIPDRKGFNYPILVVPVSQEDWPRLMNSEICIREQFTNSRSCYVWDFDTDIIHDNGYPEENDLPIGSLYMKEL